MTSAPRLLIIEGLPTSGKSTTAHLLARHLRRTGRPTRWVYEHAADHPIHDTQALAEMVRGEPYQPEAFDESLARWRTLADEIGRTEETIILESAILQPPLHLMLLAGLPESALRAYVVRVEGIIADLDPVLVHLRPPDLERSLERAMRLRGSWFGEFLEARIRESPYGSGRGLAGKEGVLAYFAHYRAITDAILETLSIRVLAIEAVAEGTDQRLGYLCRELGFDPPAPEEAVRERGDRLRGRYRAVAAEEILEVAMDDEGLFLAGDAPGRLLRADDDGFEVMGTSVTVQFVCDGEGRAVALECRAPLQDLPPRWERIP